VRTICSLVDFEIGCILSCLDVVEGERMFSRAGVRIRFFIAAELGFPEFFGLFSSLLLQRSCLECIL
jgi:hypothetical protein